MRIFRAHINPFDNNPDIELLANFLLARYGLRTLARASVVVGAQFGMAAKDRVGIPRPLCLLLLFLFFHHSTSTPSSSCSLLSGADAASGLCASVIHNNLPKARGIIALSTTTTLVVERGSSCVVAVSTEGGVRTEVACASGEEGENTQSEPSTRPVACAPLVQYQVTFDTYRQTGREPSTRPL